MLPLLALLALLVCPALGQIGFWHMCPTVTSKTMTTTETDLLKQTAGWYEQKRYATWVQTGYYCVHWKYTADTSSTRKWNAEVSMKPNNLYGEAARTLKGSIEYQAGSGSLGEYYLRITQLPDRTYGLDGKYDFRIIDITTNYFVVWTCSNRFLGNDQMFWILTKDQHPATSVISDALTAAKTAGISVDLHRLRDSSQLC